jgi:hypothetical protein
MRLARQLLEPVFKEQGPNASVLTRGDVVRTLRDQEGGSHFDPTLTEPVYIKLVKNGSAGWLHINERAATLIDPGPHLATMRQIAWEMEQTLRDLPDRLKRQAQP